MGELPCNGGAGVLHSGGDTLSDNSVALRGTLITDALRCPCLMASAQQTALRVSLEGVPVNMLLMT